MIDNGVNMINTINERRNGYLVDAMIEKGVDLLFV
jgi:hypothetical protein